jgi:hypothetical protein
MSPVILPAMSPLDSHAIRMYQLSKELSRCSRLTRREWFMMNLGKSLEGRAGRAITKAFDEVYRDEPNEPDRFLIACQRHFFARLQREDPW